MKYKVTSDNLLWDRPFDREIHDFKQIFETVVKAVFYMLNYKRIPIPTDMVIKNGTDKIVFTYTYPINSDPVSIVFNIEKID